VSASICPGSGIAKRRANWHHVADGAGHEAGLWSRLKERGKSDGEIKTKQ